MVPNIDLNALPAECRQLEIDAAFIDVQHAHITIHGSSGSFTSPINTNVIDDDVMFLTFSEWTSWARNQSRRMQPVTTVIDENLEMNTEHSEVEEPITTLCLSSKKLHTQISLGRGIIDNDNANENCISMVNDGKEPSPDSWKMSSKLIKTYTLTCPVCICTLSEPSSTICGHLFCRICIETAISKQKKCPTCRKKLTKRNFHRIYLS